MVPITNVIAAIAVIVVSVGICVGLVIWDIKRQKRAGTWMWDEKHCMDLTDEECARIKKIDDIINTYKREGLRQS